MTAADERILDLALEEELGGRRPPDLTLRILAAVRASTEGALDDTRDAGGGRYWRPLIAAAILLLAVGVGLFWSRPAPAPVPELVAVATSATDVLAFVDGEERRLRVFYGGETLVVPDGEAATVTLASGTSFELAPPAALALAAPGADAAFELLAGRVRLWTGSEPERGLAGGAGEIEIAAESDATIDVLIDPWFDPEEHVDRLRSRDLPATRTVVFGVEAGHVALVGPKPGPRVGSNEHLVHWSDGERELAPLPATSVRFVLRALLAKARLSSADIDLKGRDRVEAVKRAQIAADNLGDRVRAQPEAWSYVRPHLHQLPRTEERNDVARRLLQVLLGDGHPRTRELFVSVLETNPGVIDVNSLLLLAERGLEEAEQRLSVILAEPRAPRLPANVFPALYFAVRGDERGRAVLEAQFANEGLSGWNRPAWCGAAVGLVRLGDRAVWGDFVDRLEREVEAHLVAGNLSAAQTAVLTAAYFHRLLAVDGPVPVSFTRTRTLRWHDANRGSADSADEIRAWLLTIRELPR